MRRIKNPKQSFHIFPESGMGVAIERLRNDANGHPHYGCLFVDLSAGEGRDAVVGAATFQSHQWIGPADAEGEARECLRAFLASRKEGK